MTTTAERLGLITLDVCPPWCEGHNGTGYQDWNNYHDGTQKRSHNSDSVTVKPAAAEHGYDEFTIGVHQYEDSLAGMAPACVGVYTSGQLELTPDEARQAAKSLIAAADRVEALA